MKITLEQFGIDRLNTDERLELIELLWDSLPPECAHVPPDWHIELLKRRVAAADADPTAAERWEDVFARLGAIGRVMG